MSTKHYRGPQLPMAGEDILDSLDTMMDTSIVATPADSVAGARVILETAANAGATITPANPMIFLIGGLNQYIADGTKNSSGVWRLSPVNEIEYSEVALTGQPEIVRTGAGSYNRLITDTLATRPYDRVAIGWGVATGDVTAGRFNMVVRMQSTQDGQLARWDSADGMNTVATMNLAKIPAGVNPDINLSTMSAGTGTNRVQLSSANNATKLIVLAFPITMA